MTERIPLELLKSIPPYWFGVATQFHKLLGHPDSDHDFLMDRSHCHTSTRSASRCSSPKVRTTRG